MRLHKQITGQDRVKGAARQAQQRHQQLESGPPQCAT
jgi:hypothetical protein